MTTTNLNFNPNYTQPQPKFNIRQFFQEHQLFAILLLISIITAFIAVLIIIFSPPKQDPERAPFITFTNEDVFNDLLPPALYEDVLFYLRLILLGSEEILSAPNKTVSEQEHPVTFNLNSLRTTTINNGELYTINFTLSDNYNYSLHIFNSNDYYNQYAIVIITSINQSSTDYIITFTNYTEEYYRTIGTTTLTEYLENYSGITDSISGLPLQPIPDSAATWLESLNLNNPEIIYAHFPSS